ncbi:MAG: tetratricopeptide repeat protein [Treponema sp.]|nr:tetratricopeptide repeat protein [Treponema sp.]
MSNPNNAQFAEDFLKSGFAHLERQEYEKAVADFEAALNIEPDYTLAKDGIEAVRRARGGEQ